MKRWTVLTTVFSILGGIIVPSGCQAGKTASAGGGVGNAPDCTQACIASCTDNCEACCQEQCSDCSFNGSGSYNCSTLEGCITYCFDCNCMMFLSCIEQCFDDIASGACTDGFLTACANCVNGCAESLMSGACVSAPSNESESAYFEEGESKRTLVEGDNFTLAFEEGKIKVSILHSFSKLQIKFETVNKQTGEVTSEYEIKGNIPGGSWWYIDCKNGETEQTHTIRIAIAYGSYD